MRYIILLLFLASCAGTPPNVPGSYEDGDSSLDLSGDGMAYWQEVRGDGGVVIREGTWDASGDTLYLYIERKSFMRSRTQYADKEVDEEFSGDISGPCISLNSRTYCR